MRFNRASTLPPSNIIDVSLNVNKVISYVSGSEIQHFKLMV